MKYKKSPGVRPWRVIKSSYVLNTPWIKVKKEAVRLPDGRRLDDFYSVEGQTLVAILVLDKWDRVLLIRQYRPAVRKITTDLPGGAVEKGETSLGAARREVLEETGYKITSVRKLLTYFPDSGKKGDVKFLYVARLAEKVGRKVSGESKLIEYIWRPLSELQRSLTNKGIHEATIALAVQLCRNSQKSPVREVVH